MIKVPVKFTWLVGIHLTVNLIVFGKDSLLAFTKKFFTVERGLCALSIFALEMYNF